ncbi:MAG: hypothetical protein ACM3O4_02710 [Ignavibacteriales bacterium]
MHQDSLKGVIFRMITSRSNASDVKILDTINSIKEFINQNEDLIEQANIVDIRNDNGFKVNFKVFDRIFNDIKKEELIYGRVISSEKDDQKKIIYGKQIDSVGNTVIVFDGNPYVLIEMTLKSILANNTVIFNYDGFMLGINKLLMDFIQKALEKNGLSKYQIQQFISNDGKELLMNYANVDLVIAIGSHDLQLDVLKNSYNKSITSGYEYFDIYVESEQHMDFIKKILDKNINLYVNEKIKMLDGIIVNDIDEAISQINYNGARFGAAIFTDNADNASQFLREVKAQMVLVNTSPTFERILDISLSDLIRTKTFIYPIEYKFDNTKITID